MKSFWTAERDEAIIRLRKEGKSASQIAQAMGPITRNAVIGRLHRLRDRGVIIPAPAYPPRGRRAGAAPKGTGQGRLRKKDRVPSLPPMTASLPQVLPSARTQPARIAAASACTDAIRRQDERDAGPRRYPTILELKPGMCRYPLWQEGRGLSFQHKFFCGAPTVGGGSWCRHHLAICLSAGAPSAPPAPEPAKAAQR